METLANKIQRNTTVSVLILTLLFSFATITLKPTKTHAWPANTIVGYCKRYTRTTAGVAWYKVQAYIWNRSTNTYSFKLNWRTTTADQKSILKTAGPNSIVTSESAEIPSYGQAKVDVQTTTTTGWMSLGTIASC